MHNKAFSLLEIAIVLSIIGVVTAGGLVMLTASTQSKLHNDTVTRMEIINKALADYTYVFGKLPCPASLTLQPTDANYGVEAASNSNTCVGGTPAASFASATGTVEGALPVATLRLPMAYMYDAWGHKFRYAMNPDKTADASYPPGSGTQCTSTKAITVNDASAAARTTNADYALISHGADGHGSYTRNGVTYNADSTNTDQLENCDCDATGAATTYDGIYVQKLPTTDVADNANAFDDIVTYREGWQLQSNNNALASTNSCGSTVYVADCGNARISVFDGSGNFIKNIGEPTLAVFAGNGCSMSSDSAGNLWIVQDYMIYKFDTEGNLLLSHNNYANTGAINSLYVDHNDNVWVSSTYANYVHKYNSSMVFQMKVGCGGAFDDACPASTADGALTNPFGIAVDSSDNIYISDDGVSGRIQKFNSAGVYQSKYEGYSGNDHIIDSNNNLWASGGHDIVKFNLSLVPQTTIGTYNCCGPLEYQRSSGIAVETDGTIWIADFMNNYVQKVNADGTYANVQIGCPEGVDCTVWGTGPDSANGRFDTPRGIVVQSSR